MFPKELAKHGPLRPEETRGISEERHPKKIHVGVVSFASCHHLMLGKKATPTHYTLTFVLPSLPMYKGLAHPLNLLSHCNHMNRIRLFFRKSLASLTGLTCRLVCR